MASSFLGLYVQRDAIQLAQKALDITGNNISNINSEGYTRQRLDVCSVAHNKGSLGYNTKTDLAGQGADAIGVTQIRDKLLDTKVRKYNSELCDTGSKTTILSDIEDILDDVENSETGLSAIMGNWKAAFQSFHATAADRTDLANIAMNAGNSVLNVMRNFDIRMKDVEISTKNDLNSTNTRVNAILKDMAGINKQIEDAYVQMNDVYTTKEGYMADVDYGPLELKDKFNALADELSQYMNITVTETKTGSYTVEFGDKTLVQKDKYAKTDIKFTHDKADEITDADGVTKMMRGFQEMPNHDENGNVIEGNAAAGTKIYDAEGNFTGLKADGNGGYVDEDGNETVVYIYDESKKYFDADGNEIKNLGTVNDGQVVTDEAGNTIKVHGSFEGEGIQYEFSEFYVSSINTARGWEKSRRELTPEMEEAGIGDMIVKFNSLLESSDVEEAFRYEKEIMKSAGDKGVEYKPIFLENMDDPEMAPEYAISVYEETDRMKGGSLKGLFDMYNGEGCYAGLNGNSYKGIKYYQETVRSLATAVEREFNGLYDDYNADHPDDQFKMFTFDGVKTVSNIRIADEWNNNPLRAVHPTGTEEEDYNYDELSNEYLNKLLSVFSKKIDYGTEPLNYTLEEFVANYGNTLGGQLEYELSNFESTTTMYNSVCEAREEVMGVSMDEEGVNMMNYQKWYNAISRMINAMDECLEKLINGTGIVGR